MSLATRVAATRKNPIIQFSAPTYVRRRSWKNCAHVRPTGMRNAEVFVPELMSMLILRPTVRHCKCRRLSGMRATRARYENILYRRRWIRIIMTPL